MIALHSGWLGGELLLWGECPRDAASARTPARRGRKARKDTPAAPSYPYDAGPEALMAALAAAGGAVEPKKAARRAATAWLPMQEGEPIPSSPLIAEPPQSKGEATLAPWGISAVALTPEEAVELL